ncbi:MAG: tetratricopeptide repeat protein [Deltaproteobacteria bacterium]|nr:tetratricopeptide repeat protein [Deltaproteobacteria bacterium]
MSKLLEIFGKGISVDTAEILWHWLNTVLTGNEMSEASGRLNPILDHLANRELVPAEDKLKLYLFDHPECVYGRMTAAVICLHHNQPKEAIEQAQSIYLRQPSNTMALYLLGHCYERLGKIEQALEFYQDCIKFKSHLQLPRQRMAAIYLKEGRLDQVVRQYEQITTEHQDDISSLVLLGHLYIAASEYENAIDTFNLAILSHPDNFLANREEDEIEGMVNDGMFEQAMEKIQWMIEQVGLMPDLLVRMADVYSQWGREAEAIACYENAIRLQPNSLEASIKLGTHYLRNQKFSLAAEQFNRAAEINDEIVDAYLGLVKAQNLSGEEAEAGQTLSLAASIQQNSTLLYSESATLQFQSVLDQNITAKAESDKPIVLINDVIRAYQEQLRKNPCRADVQYKYGILMMVENNLPMAISAFQNVLPLNPIHYRALNKLAICYFDDGRPEKAMNALIGGVDQGDASVFEMYYKTAILYCDKIAFSQAFKKLQLIKVTELNEHSEIQANIEIVLENLGLIDRAFANWKRLEETSESLLEIHKVRHT